MYSFVCESYLEHAEGMFNRPNTCTIYHIDSELFESAYLYASRLLFDHSTLETKIYFALLCAAEAGEI